MSKFAAREAFLSPGFIAWYAGMLGVLVVYAIGWQQILKRLPLTVAFANKSITVIWGMIWGLLLFGEQITPMKVVGGIIVIVGIVLFALADGEERARKEQEGAENRETPPGNGSAGS